jgi:hypothetical protein
VWIEVDELAHTPNLCLLLNSFDKLIWGGSTKGTLEFLLGGRSRIDRSSSLDVPICGSLIPAFAASCWRVRPFPIRVSTSQSP